MDDTERAIGAILAPVSKLTRDQKKAAATLGRSEARYLVDTYYQMQHDRITAGNRIRAASESDEPHTTLSYMGAQFETLEGQIKGALGKYAEAQAQGAWAMSQVGVGPVITAGLLSRLELRPTVGAWWRLAGLDPTVRWEKGQKRPWNAALKRICWLAGESFVKVSGRSDAVYGLAYKGRKEYEEARNEAGGNEAAAAEALTRKRFGDDTKAKAFYLAGKLPPAHVHSRAKRWTVKLFLSHLHHVWHEVETGSPPPRPYIIEHGGHAHFIAPPGWKD